MLLQKAFIKLEKMCFCPKISNILTCHFLIYLSPNRIISERKEAWIKFNNEKRRAEYFFFCSKQNIIITIITAFTSFKLWENKLKKGVGHTEIFHGCESEICHNKVTSIQIPPSNSDCIHTIFYEITICFFVQRKS